MLIALNAKLGKPEVRLRYRGLPVKRTASLLELYIM